VIGGATGWTVSPGHFAERHGLILIIALGESVVAIGVGAAGLDLDAGLLVGGVLGIALAAALWWAYFDVVAPVAERRLRSLEGVERARLARDSYSYLHLPMIAGIVLIALGVKKTVGHVGDPLDGIPAVALCGGAALYLLAQVAFRLRNLRTLNRQRLVAAVLCLAAIPIALAAPALAALAVVTAVCVGLIAFEVVRFAEARRRVLAAEE
jgi:low temperature requirement protein LtrA